MTACSPGSRRCPRRAARREPPAAPAEAPAAPPEGAGIQGVFAALRGDAPVDLYDRCTCWWVPSQDSGRPARALLRRGLPAPAEYTTMIALDGDAGIVPAPGAVLGATP